ncbi:MAG: HD domain-containing protein [Oscillospiraceae bacterium]|nr:HD domain-containing protein [Oscillospiraceae bacterium]
MERPKYEQIEAYMQQCMGDSAHDQEHVYRVLHNGLLIAETETDVDRDVLICACLLHDIGRAEQFADPSLCHAQVGGEKAFRFLLDHGFTVDFAEKVRECITTHRFRENNQPQSMEAKILFDADKLDVAGAMGIARTLLYQGHVTTPLYSRTPDGSILDGSEDTAPSFFQEYKFKLENLYDRFYTNRGRELALARRSAAVDFYNALLREVREANIYAAAALEQFILE